MPIDNLSKITSRTGISTTILLEAGNVNATGIATLGSGGSGQAILEYQGTTRLKTEADRIDTFGHLNIGGNNDNALLRFGVNNDFVLYHDGDQSFINNHTTNLKINAPQVSISTNFSVGGISTFNGNINLIRPGSSTITGNLKSNYTTFDIIDTTHGAQLRLRGGSPTLVFDRSGGTGSAELYFDDNGFKIFQGQPAGGGSTEVVSITNDGNVGINSTAPTSKLDVDGDVKVSGITTFSDTVKVGTGVTALTNGNVSIGGTLDLSMSQVGFNNPSQIKLSDLVIGQHQNTGSYKIENGSTGSLLFRADMINFATSNGGTSLLRTSTSEVQIFSGNTARFVVNGIGATVFGELDVTGNVGINTGIPRQKLHLDNGYMFVRGDTAPQVRMNAAINDPSTTRFTFGLATGANNFFNGAQSLDGCVTAPSTGRLLFGVGNDAELFILNSGDISINRSSQLANAKLSLQCDPAQEGIAVNLNQNSGISTAFAIWNTGGEIFNLAQDTDSTPDLIFKIKGSGESAPVEKVRIESGGNVGIGTDDAVSKLHVGGTFSVITQSFLTDHTHPSRGGNALFVSNNTTIETARFYCSAAGNTKIHIECSSNNGDSELHFCDQEDRTTGGTDHYEKSSGKIIYEHDNDAFKFDTNRTEKLRITSSGFVGIGTNNPDEKLHVYNGAGDVTSFVEAIAGDALLNLSNSGNGNYSGINFIRERGSGQTGRNGGSIFMPSNTANNEAFLYIQAQSTSAHAGVTGALSANNGVRLKLHGDDGIFSVETGAAERLRIDSSGRLLVGTTSNRVTRLATNSFSPKMQLEDDTEAAFSMSRFVNSAGPPRFVLQKARGTGASPVVVQNDDDIGQILFSGWDGDTFTNGAEIIAEVDGTPGDDQMPGRLIFKTNAGGTNNTERLRITSGGAVGININAPEAQFHVENDNAHGSTYYLNSDAAILVDNKNASGKAVIKLEHDAALVYGSGSSSFIISDRENERLRIDTNGNLKQGTSNPGPFTSTSPTNGLRFLGNKVMQGAVSSTTTLNGSGAGTFDLGKLWTTDDTSIELFIQVVRNDSANFTTHYAKAFINKVRGGGMSQGHILYQNGAAQSNGFSITGISAGGYTGSGGSAHGTQITVTGGAGGVIYRATCFYTAISKNAQWS